MLQDTDVFAQATRLKLRFDSPKGQLTTEDLWDLPLQSSAGKANLDSIAVGLDRASRAAAETASFVDPSSQSNPELDQKLSIAKHIIAVRLAERDKARDLADRNEKKQQLLELIARKQNEELAGKPIEELLAMVNAL